MGRAAKMHPAFRKKVAEAVAAEHDRDFGEWEIGRIDLMESVLSREGAAYAALQSFPLASPAG